MSCPAESRSGPPRVARVDGRVGLDHVADGDAADALHLAAERADDAGGQRVIEAEGVADGDRLLPDLERDVTADADGLRAGSRGTSTLRTAMSLRGSTPTTFASNVCWSWKVTVSDRASVDDVEVGDDVPVVVPDEARARSRRRPPARAAEVVDHHPRLRDEDRRWRDALGRRRSCCARPRCGRRG